MAIKYIFTFSMNFGQQCKKITINQQLQIIETQKDHDIWHWKSFFIVGTLSYFVVLFLCLVNEGERWLFDLLILAELMTVFA